MNGGKVNAKPSKAKGRGGGGSSSSKRPKTSPTSSVPATTTTAQPRPPLPTSMLVARSGVLRSADESADTDAGGTLILCPTSLLPQWCDEFAQRAGARRAVRAAVRAAYS